MNSIKKIFYVFPILFILTLLFTSTVCLAQVSPKIISSAQDSFEKQFIPTLKLDYKNYGLTDNNDVDAAILSNGRRYYEISNDNIKNIKDKNTTFSNTKLFNSDEKYVFSIKIKDKYVGLAFVEKFKGVWQVVEIGDYKSFEKDMNIASSILASKSDDDTKLVFDRRLNFIALMKENSDTNSDLVPINSNSDLGFIKGTKSNISQSNINKIINLSDKITSENQFGGFGTSDNSTKSKNSSLTITLICIGGLSILGLGIYRVKYIKGKV